MDLIYKIRKMTNNVKVDGLIKSILLIWRYKLILVNGALFLAAK